MTSKTNTRDHITALFQSFAGQDKALVIPRPYIDLCKGDHLAALLLSQILYWADRTADPEGWFAKSYDEWHDELGMTEYQVKRAIKGDRRSKNKSFALTAVGIETDLRQSKFHHGAATLHYRVNHTVLRKSVVAFLSDLNNVQNGNQTMFRTAPEQCSERSSESTTESTTEKELAAQAPPVEAAEESQAPIEKPLTPHQRMFGAICDAWGYNLAAITKSKRGQINGAVGELMDTNATPEDMPAFKAWLEAQVSSGKWRSYTVSAMAKYWADFEKEYHAPPPAPIRWDYGDVTQEDIQDEIVAEFRAKLATPGAFDDRLTPEERDAQELAA